MPQPLSVHLLYPKTNTFGLLEDVVVMERVLKKVAERSDVVIQKPKRLDPREGFSPCDLQIHLETPVYGAIPWSPVNWMWVNPEQWTAAYDGYLHAFDAFLFRDPDAAERFRVQWPSVAEKVRVVPWCSSWSLAPASPLVEMADAFVCLVAGSLPKGRYVSKVIRAWRSTDPPLTLYTTREDIEAEWKETLASVGENGVRIVRKELTLEEQRDLLQRHRGHLVVSQAESFGYAAAHSETVGGFTILNRLPTFVAQYEGGDAGAAATATAGVAWLSNRYEAHSSGTPLASPVEGLREELDQAFLRFRETPAAVYAEARRQRAQTRQREAEAGWVDGVRQAVEIRKERRPAKGIYHLPPILEVRDCPPISVITPTFQRKRLMEIAFHNLLSTDYPRAKMEWIVVEDNDKTPHMMARRLSEFQATVPELTIRYITLEGRRSIGEKRNKGVELASHDIVLFMDDDDHYPPTSFRRRVAWLTKGRVADASPRAAVCTTIALYDLKRGISAVNVPPLDIPFAQRVSEATLTFYKSFWQERPFPEVSLSEGEAWLEGRTSEVLELPPQQLIVAFSHGANQSSRRLPPSDQPPSCFWGFPKEYLVFVHGLVGVDIA